MNTVLSEGIIHPPVWVNLSFGLMITFFVCELAIAPFFLLDNLIGLGKMIRRAWKGGDQKTVATIEGHKDIVLEKQPRRQFLKKAGLILGSLPFASFLYGITIGKYRFTVHNQRVVFDDLPAAFDGFRVAHISDIHSGSFDDLESVQRGIKMIQAQAPDIIFFTGDLVNNHAKEIEPFIEDFADLVAPYGKFSVLGNHDYPRYRFFKTDAEREENFSQIKVHHQSMGFNLLLNQNVKIEKNGQHIRLLGVENWGRSRHFPKEGDLDKTCQGCQEEEFNILLSHDPTYWADKVLAYPKKIQLTLSGHTHGLQAGIDLPWLKWSPVKYVYEHWAGLYQELGKYLYVNRGFGFLGFAGRVGIFPEITILELKKTKT